MNAEEALLQLPAKIRRTELDLWTHKQQLDGARLRLKLHEADVGLAIAQAVEEGTGKKKFTNADQRDAATAARLEADAEHRANRKAVEEEAATIARIEAALGYLRDTQRNARVLMLARSPPTLIFEPEDLGVAATGPTA